MLKLTEKDASILDNILKVVLSEGEANSYNLPPLRDNIFSKLFFQEDYKYYFDKLEEYQIVEFKEYISGGIGIFQIPIKTSNFYNQGGFKKIYEEEQKELSRIKLTDKKFQWDFLNSKLGIFSFIISIISLIIAIIALLKK
jgi:hypothetical protein